MERGVATLEEVAVEEIIDLPSISNKRNFVSGCFRIGEDHEVDGKLPRGWGDCKICTPDYLACKNKDFILNRICEGYIPCRIFNVISKDLEIENSKKQVFRRYVMKDLNST